MKIKRPETFAGIPLDGAYQRWLDKFEREEKENKNPINPIIVPSNINQEGFIYLPSSDIYIAKQRTHLGLNWYDAHKQLHQENLLMPTIPQFLEFIKYLKGDYQNLGNKEKQEAEQILDDILTVRDPWRTEWLDAKFEKKDKRFYINYNHRIDSQGNLTPQNSEPLEDCLMEDKTPGIDLDNLLVNHTNQGLPNKNIKKGKLYYWFPRSDNNSVARFVVNSGRADLNCNRHPENSSASLGVRASFQRS